MLKIVVNHNKENIIYSYSIGQTFPDINGKLLSIEANGKELLTLLSIKEIPLSNIDNLYLTWNRKHAGSILKLFKEALSKC